MEVADTVSAQPPWQDIPTAVLVVRQSPAPALGALGWFDAVDEARVEALFGQIDDALARLRYVTYQQAEEDVAALAARLVDRLGGDYLERCSFRAIPRGGLIVLGMLAAVLGLRPEQLDSGPPSDGPVVVVDDCALTGNRFARYVEKDEAAEIVFAHLYSHPDLRAAIERGEDRVSACISARDLTDWGPTVHGDGYGAWRERWLQRAGGARYWLGVPDYLCFPWKEPDRPFWNAAAGEVEACWRLVPPDRCLSNASAAPAITVFAQPHARGPLRPAPAVIYARVGEELVVGSGETGEAVGLDGVAAEMWEAVVDRGRVEDAAAALSALYDADPATLSSDLASFVSQLRERRLLDVDDAISHPV